MSSCLWWETWLRFALLSTQTPAWQKLRSQSLWDPPRYCLTVIYNHLKTLHNYYSLILLVCRLFVLNICFEFNPWVQQHTASNYIIMTTQAPAHDQHPHRQALARVRAPRSLQSSWACQLRSSSGMRRPSPTKTSAS